MANSGIIALEGFRALGERLKTLESSIAKKIARSATLAAANVIKKAAKELAPIAPEAYIVRSKKGDAGVLVNPKNIGKNIINKKIKSGLTSEHIVTVRGKRKDGYAKRIGILQEFGTAKMPAQPFMRPAFDGNKEAAIEAMKAKIVAGLTGAGV